MEGSRPATDADLDRLVELARDAIAELKPSRGGAVWARREARAEPLEPGLTADLHDPKKLTVVGLIDEVVVGYAVVGLEELRTGEHLAVLTDLYVEPEARAVSVGEAMMDHVVAWCEGEGCVGIDGFTLPGQRETKNFFERFGLVARAIIVHRPLKGRETAEGPDYRYG